MPDPSPSRELRSDTLLWPIDRDFLLGFAPAGLSAAGMLFALWLFHHTCPEGQARIVVAVFAGHAVLWLLFAPLYLFSWVHNHPRRAVAETGRSGSAALAVLMWLLNILVYAVLLSVFRWGSWGPENMTL